ncbi:hypothetical protein [Bradyrhizobium sp. JYMT SZCCT0428]|uniref:hypothetical protein n=1 Tax=Bradyrhizobium sp. JYMT SZCCT0428 TaxID=2807673 RepID=UPI001BAD8F44|nr:hypothetical protein [Bradyrhizobium sp. JYMT SZCCT0428]MBR1157105.1 hypothetical protein [Bradyrhizobium sp. JYMT SZCCT0428]
MIIILCLYVVVMWLVFSKFRLVKWGWLFHLPHRTIQSADIPLWIAESIRDPAVDTGN